MRRGPRKRGDFRQLLRVTHVVVDALPAVKRIAGLPDALPAARCIIHSRSSRSGVDFGFRNTRRLMVRKYQVRRSHSHLYCESKRLITLEHEPIVSRPRSKHSEAYSIRASMARSFLDKAFRYLGNYIHVAFVVNLILSIKLTISEVR